MMVNPVYENAKAFNEGLAAVQRESKWGYIGTNGTTMIPLIYEEAGDFHQGLAQVKTNGDLCWVDKEGQIVWRPTTTKTVSLGG
jgi:hypothetical protein